MSPGKRNNSNIKNGVARLQYSNQQLQRALEGRNNGMSYRLVERTYGVPRSTLCRKVANKETTKADFKWCSVLSQQEEADIYEWIIRCAETGHPRSSRQILRQVQKVAENPNVVRANKFPNGTPSLTWLSRFIARYGGLHKKKLKFISLATASLTESGIRHYHARVSQYLMKKGLYSILFHPHRVANADETYLNFTTRFTNGYVSKSQAQGTTAVKYDQKVHLTVMFTALATGELLPPQIIYPYERMRADIKKNFPSKDIILSKTKTGYMNELCFLEYLQQVVVPYLDEDENRRPFILVVDKHSSHFSLSICEFCQLHQIELLTLYPNATHLLQPLDKEVFSHLKSMYDAFLLDKDENLDLKLDRATFAPLLKEFIDQKRHLLAAHVKKGFETTGIWPWNVNAIEFDKLLSCCRQKDPDDVEIDRVVVECSEGKV